MWFFNVITMLRIDQKSDVNGVEFGTAESQISTLRQEFPPGIGREHIRVVNIQNWQYRAAV